MTSRYGRSILALPLRIARQTRHDLDPVMGGELDRGSMQTEPFACDRPNPPIRSIRMASASPSAGVKRGEMAVFLTHALNLTPFDPPPPD